MLYARESDEQVLRNDLVGKMGKSLTYSQPWQTPRFRIPQGYAIETVPVKWHLTLTLGKPHLEESFTQW